MKTLLLALGATGAVAAPVAALVACGSSNDGKVKISGVDSEINAFHLSTLIIKIDNGVKTTSDKLAEYVKQEASKVTDKVEFKVNGVDAGSFDYKHGTVAEIKSQLESLATNEPLLKEVFTPAATTGGNTNTTTGGNTTGGNTTGGTNQTPSMVTKYSYKGTDYDTEAAAKAAVDKDATAVKVFTISADTTEYATADAALEASFAKLTKNTASFNDSDLASLNLTNGADVSGLTAAGTKTIYVENSKAYATEDAAKAAWLAANPIKTQGVGSKDGKDYTAAQIAARDEATAAPAKAVVGVNTAAVAGVTGVAAVPAVGAGDGQTYTQAQIDKREGLVAPANAVVGANTAEVKEVKEAATEFTSASTFAKGDTLSIGSKTFTYDDGTTPTSADPLKNIAAGFYSVVDGTIETPDATVPAKFYQLTATTYTDTIGSAVAGYVAPVAAVPAVGAGDGKTYTQAQIDAANATTAAPANAVVGVNTAEVKEVVAVTAVTAVGAGDGQTYTQAQIDKRDGGDKVAPANAVVGTNTAKVANTLADAPAAAQEQVKSSVTFADGDAFNNAWKPAGTTTVYYLGTDKTQAFSSADLLKAHYKTAHAADATQVDSASKVSVSGTEYANKAAAYTALITSKQVTAPAAKPSLVLDVVSIY